jgi:hypothetical protein
VQPSATAKSSSALCGRLLGSFSRHRSTISSSSGGIGSSVRRDGGTGAASTCWTSIFIGVAHDDFGRHVRRRPCGRLVDGEQRLRGGRAIAEDLNGVRRRQRGGGLCLAFEAAKDEGGIGAAAGAKHLGPHEFDRDPPVEHRMTCRPDLAHAAVTEPLEELIPVTRPSDRKE